MELLTAARRRGDVDAVVSMPAEDAAWSMPPLAARSAGPDGIRGFLLAGPLSGEPHLPFALDVPALEGDRIEAITSFVARRESQSNGLAVMKKIVTTISTSVTYVQARTVASAAA